MPFTPFKICFVSDAESYGGAEKYTEELSLCFIEKGHSCNFIINRNNSIFYDKLLKFGLPCTRMNFGRYYDVRYQIPIFRQLRRDKPDIVHINLPGPYNCSMAAATAQLAGAKKIVSTEHLPMMKKWPKPGFIKTIASRVIDTTIVVSYENKRYLEQIHGVKPDKIEVVQNGINLMKFTSDAFENERILLRHKYGFLDQDLVFGIIGRLTPQKGHIYAFEALAKVHCEMPEIRLLCVGEGELETELKTKAEELGLGGKIIFAGFQKNMPAHYASIDVLLMPSLFEGLPLSLLEAMAMKKVAVASRINGIPEVIDDHADGILLPKKDTDAIAEAMKRIYADRSRLTVWGENAHEKIKKKFLLEHMAKKTEAIYNQTQIKRTHFF